MANSTPSFSGQALGAGATDALFLKTFAGEVLTTFENENKTKDRTTVRTLANGKSASFPVVGRGRAFYHVPGNEILGGMIKHNEVLITIDDLLISDAFIATIDEAKAHYDYRSIYSSEVGRMLAQVWDKQALQVGVLAARTTTANIPGESPIGATITEATAGAFNTPDTLAATFFKAKQIFTEKNISEEGRVAYISPALYNILIQSDKFVSRDFQGDGNRKEGKIGMIAGIEIVETNNLPNTNITTGVQAGTGSKYIGDFTKTLGLFMHRSAIGTLQLLSLATEMEYDIRRQGTLVLAKMAIGHGVLRPEAAIELKAF